MKDYFEGYGKYAEVNGVRTHYYDVGKGKPLVLIHGGGVCVASAIQWRYNIEKLSESFRVIAPDELGFGMTEVPRKPDYSLTERAEHISGFLKVLGIKSAALCGQSQGAWIASYIYFEHPELVSKLIFCNTGSITMERGRASTKFDFDSPFNLEVTRKFYSRIVYNKDLITEEMAELAYEYGKRNFETRRKDQERHSATEEGRLLNNSYKGKHISNFISRINLPTLIIWGANDVVPVERGFWLYNQIKGAEISVLQNAGHLVFMDRHQAFNSLVEIYVMGE
ncbi:MAG: alpha/beta hydrolase [Candidatus Thermoplasmatota archaeon]|nr:alpha/beta hydrolase [Candidatus Thermoplasmatota archaeon]